MKTYEINIRGTDHKGSFTLQTRIESESPYQALNAACTKWGIHPHDLTKIHVQEQARGSDLA